jgi:hypothetical protein
MEINRITKTLTICVLIFSIQFSLKAEKSNNSDFIGQWGGKIEYAERLEAINIQFNETDNLITGNITFVYDKMENRLENILINDSTISFECEYDKGKLHFKGHLCSDILSGQIILSTPRDNNLEGNFELIKGQLIKEDRLFLERLIKYAEYKNEVVNLERTFEYMDSSDSNLRELRNKYNLDSVAGAGSESSMLINLMRWVQNVLPYNGQCGKIEPINSLYLLESEKAKEKGINCNMKATILNEVYLAMGFKSRVIHCLAKGNNFIEDHFINMVYSTDLEKWIYMDPSVGGYLKDERGVLLSIQEVRQKLIKGERIILNSEAVLPNDLYLHYMLKNLFRFESQFKSEFNSVSNDNLTCHLYPKLYMDTNTKNGNGIIVSNPDFFWVKPE